MDLLNKEYHDNALKSLSFIEDIVCATLGANGLSSNIPKPIFQNGQQIGVRRVPSKDGISVLAALTNHQDPTIAMFASMLYEAVTTQYKVVGDGTTTATLLSCVFHRLMYAEMSENPNQNRHLLVKKYEQYADEIVRRLEKQRIEVTTADELVKIATVSANNNNELGKIIGNAVFEVGRYGKTTSRVTTEAVVRAEMIKGYGVQGAQQRYWIEAQGGSRFEENNCLLMITTDLIETVAQVHAIFKAHAAAGNGAPLIVVCHDISELAAANINADNNYRIQNGGRPHKILFVKHGLQEATHKREFMNDLSFVSGAKLISQQFATASLLTVEPKHFGKLSRVLLSQYDGIFQFDAPKTMEAYVAEIQHEIALLDTPEPRKDWLNERLSKLVGSNAIIHVGGLTSTESSINDDSVDDAIKTATVALKNGYLLGGGIALLNCIQSDDYDNIGEICGAPLVKMCENSSIDESIRNDMSLSANIGIDYFTGELIDYKERGIFDSYESQVSAVKVGFSFAKTLIISQNAIGL